MAETPITVTWHRRRKLGIKLLDEGKSKAEVARLLGVTREAVRRWAAAYEGGGARALKPSPGPRGPRSKLTEAELRAVVAEARQLHGRPTLNELYAVACRQHPRLSFSIASLRRRLMSLGLWSRSRA